MKNRVVGLVMLMALLVGTRAVMAETPRQVLGEWLVGSPSITTYWDQNGTYVGPASGSGQFYRFNADGTFDYYMYMEMNSYNTSSKVRTRYHGKVNFSDSQFTLQVEKGHYDSNMGTRVINRDMTEAEMVKASKAFDYRVEEINGKTKFIVPFSDGSKFEFDRSASSK